ncbi:MAG: DUF115 domain-containing protein [Phycisphaeraceae bacterium]|nr:MAG: DUF115 domain-containing protein [Phycisphaeraceae bacterium]
MLTTPSYSPDAPLIGGGLTLESNLSAIGAASPHIVAMLRQTDAAPGIEFIPTEDNGALSAMMDGKALASRRRPLEEAKRLAETVDLRKAGAVVVMGFGLGHHVAALAKRMKREGIIIVYEPDLRLLRAAMERIDHGSWLRESNVVFLTDAEDTASMSALLNGAEGVLAMGVHILEHPPSRSRLGDSARRFGVNFSGLVTSVRTTVVTTMVQTEVTMRNLFMNADHYCLRAGVADLAGACAGRPAIVVSAGPSLERNIHLLKTPGVRERVVIIAVQTTLKTLLAMGVKPHFVTALDYHEISRRFYEGLTESDVEGVTLVAEPKANPAILDAFPGAIRCAGDGLLDRALGEELAGEHGDLTPGATVAHLAYYLARHLGCDPVALIGQDLGFTDGQYYSAGAAIHDVWACELNSFNTLEMMEWQRIARAKSMLRRATDHLGRPVYTDEQMSTYLAQFERDFKADAQRGLTTIDATEGGVAKAQTRPMALSDFLERHAGPDAPLLPALAPAAPAGEASMRAGARKRLDEVRRGVVRMGALSRQTASLLERIRENHGDQKLVNKLIAQVNRIRDEVQAIDPGYELVQKLNQTGAFKRARADRELRLEAGLTALETQRRQIDRDAMNVRWLAEAADAMAEILEEACKALDGAPKRTRDVSRGEIASIDSPDGAGERKNAPSRRATRRIGAVIPVELERTALGTRRDQGATFLGRHPLRATLERLARCRRLDRVVLLTDAPEALERIVRPEIRGLRIEIVATEGPPLGRRVEGLRGARLWTDNSWRGGLGSFTCFDEALAPEATAAALERFDLDGALLVGADWCLVDPELCDAVIERHLERPEKHRVSFSQAPPGLAGCVIERGLVTDLAATMDKGGSFASVAGLLGYVPVKPQADPIAHPMCAPVSPLVRDTLFRCIPDSAPRRVMLEQAMLLIAGDRGWSAVVEADAETIAQAIRERMRDMPTGLPKQTIVELCPGRRSLGRRVEWLWPGGDVVERPVMTRELADRIFTALGEERNDAVVDFAGFGDPLLHPECIEFVKLAKDCGVAGVHVRTDLLCDEATVDALLESGVDIVSVDLMAQTAETYRAIMGQDAYKTVLTNVDRLLNGRTSNGGLPTPWIAPRITRCDAVYEEIESFFDKWLLLAGAAVIDQAPRAIEGERIRPLGKPNAAKRRDWRSRMMVLSDGAVVVDERDAAGEGAIGNLTDEPLGTVWRRLLERRRDTWRREGYGHADLWTGW